MEEQLITFETAKLALEKGLFLRTPKMYIEGKLKKRPTEHMSSMRERFTDICGAPTQSLLQKWIRDVHNIHISLEEIISNHDTVWVQELSPTVRNKVLYYHQDPNTYKSYEEALEEGLKQALKLIK